MAPIPNGPYGIAERGEQNLTLHDEKAPAIVLPVSPVSRSGTSRASPTATSPSRTCGTKRTSASTAFLESTRCYRGSSQATEWQLRQSAEPRMFHVVVPGGPVDGLELAADLSLLRIFPMTALRPLDPENLVQAWRFEFHP